MKVLLFTFRFNAQRTGRHVGNITKAQTSARGACRVGTRFHRANRGPDNQSSSRSIWRNYLCVLYCFWFRRWWVCLSCVDDIVRTYVCVQVQDLESELDEMQNGPVGPRELPEEQIDLIRERVEKRVLENYVSQDKVRHFV